LTGYYPLTVVSFFQKDRRSTQEKLLKEAQNNLCLQKKGATKKSTRVSKKEEEEIVKAYKSNPNKTKIAKIFQRNYGTIHRVLQRNKAL
jgi:predicted Zn-dependent protease